MAKVKIKGIDELAKKLNSNLRIQSNKLFRDKDLRAKIGSMIVADIKKNVDMGAASKATIESRKRLEQTNNTDSAYKRGRIKAVFTGELLKDLGSSVVGVPTKSQFEVEHSSKLHKKYKGKNGAIGKRIAFDKLSSILIDDMGYNYIKLSDKAQKDIANLIRDRFLSLLR
jgi:hypothetical protein